jgi:predicted RNase H-like HicB family nuclease
MKTYIFEVELEQDDDGRWSATIPALVGCSTWGYTKEEALQALREAAKAYLEVSLSGRPGASQRDRKESHSPPCKAPIARRAARAASPDGGARPS